MPSGLVMGSAAVPAARPQSKDDPTLYCIKEIGHSGRHKYRPMSLDGPLN